MKKPLGLFHSFTVTSFVYRLNYFLFRGYAESSIKSQLCPDLSRACDGQPPKNRLHTGSMQCGGSEPGNQVGLDPISDYFTSELSE